MSNLEPISWEDLLIGKMREANLEVERRKIILSHPNPPDEALIKLHHARGVYEGLGTALKTLRENTFQ